MQYGFWKTLWLAFAAGLGWRLAGMVWRLVKWGLVLLVAGSFPVLAKIFGAM